MDNPISILPHKEQPDFLVGKSESANLLPVKLTKNLVQVNCTLSPGIYYADENYILKSFACMLAKVTAYEVLESCLFDVFKINGLFGNYFIFINPQDQEPATTVFSKQAAYLKDEDFIGLVEQSDSILQRLNLRIQNSGKEMLLDITAAVQEGSVDPWFFFLHRSGIKSVLGIPILYGNKHLGVVWLEPVKYSLSLFRSMAAQLSVILYTIIATERIESLSREIELSNKKTLSDRANLHPTGNMNASNLIIGKSIKMRQVFELVQKVASSYATVLITGETGTGKELIASNIHELSPRKDQPFITLNCAALAPNLIESELFGHERGSFTGAVERRLGKFELANNGTLFLDEIGELPIDLQVKLLRAIQEKEIERLGGSKIIKINVRLIAATNRNLQDEVLTGKFRSDLYYRLNVFPIALPPLRERKEDISHLVAHFIEAYANKNSLQKSMSVSASAMHLMMDYHWPGNIRELEHLIERSLLLESGPVLREVYLPDKSAPNLPSQSAAQFKTLEDMEREYILTVLKHCAGKISGSGGAAEKLGIPATTLSSKISRLKITKKELHV